MSCPIHDYSEGFLQFLILKEPPIKPSNYFLELVGGWSLQFLILKGSLILLGKLLGDKAITTLWLVARLQGLIVQVYSSQNTGQWIQVTWWQCFMSAKFDVFQYQNYTNIV